MTVGEKTIKLNTWSSHTHTHTNVHSKTDRVALNWLIASTSAAASDALNAGCERPNLFFFPPPLGVHSVLTTLPMFIPPADVLSYRTFRDGCCPR